MLPVSQKMKIFASTPKVTKSKPKLNGSSINLDNTRSLWEKSSSICRNAIYNNSFKRKRFTNFFGENGSIEKPLTAESSTIFKHKFNFDEVCAQLKAEEISNADMQFDKLCNWIDKDDLRHAEENFKKIYENNFSCRVSGTPIIMDIKRLLLGAVNLNYWVLSICIV